MRLKLHRLALALAIALAPAHAQILHPSGPLPSYEVATIKPVDGAPPPSPGGPPPMPRDEMLRFVNTRILIASAYNAEAFARSEIIGGPSWLDSQIYEIHTKIGGPLSDAMQQISNAQRKKNMELMDQSLLADRFKLKVHFETRQLPQYALVAAKGSPKLAAAVNPSGPHNRSMQMPSGQNMELTATAWAASRSSRRCCRWSPRSAVAGSSTGPVSPASTMSPSIGPRIELRILIPTLRSVSIHRTRGAARPQAGRNQSTGGSSHHRPHRKTERELIAFVLLFRQHLFRSRPFAVPFHRS